MARKEGNQVTNTTPKPIRYRTAKVTIGAAAGAAVLLGAVYLGTSAPAVASVATTVTTLSPSTSTSLSAAAVPVQRTRSDDGRYRTSSDDGGYAATSNAAPAPVQQQSAPAPLPQPRVSRGS